MNRNLARVVVLGALTTTFAGGVSRATSVTPADLEGAFWHCDYAASTTGLVDAFACSSIYEELKNGKFKGDFDAMWIWWQQNKAAQHHAIAAASH